MGPVPAASESIEIASVQSGFRTLPAPELMEGLMELESPTRRAARA